MSGSVALAAVLTGALIGSMLSDRAAPAPASGLRVSGVARLTHDPGLSEWPTWSPDGRNLAYCRSNGGASLWRLTLATD